MIWVRSQDKEELFETRELIMTYDGLSTYGIMSMTGDGLGSYSTKEKALKVLDMIQQHICNIKSLEIGSNMITCQSTSVNLDDYVFQMPLDSEVEE